MSNETYLKSKGIVKNVFVGKDEDSHFFEGKLWLDTPQSALRPFGGFILDRKPENDEHYRQLGRKGIDYLFRICEIFGYEDNCNFNLLLEKECEVILKKGYTFTEYFEVIAIGNNGKWFNSAVYWGKEQYILSGAKDYTSLYCQMEIGKEYKRRILSPLANGVIECELVEV